MQVKVDAESIAVPPRKLAVVESMLRASKPVIVVDFMLPEDQAVALNRQVGDPGSQLYRQKVTCKALDVCLTEFKSTHCML